MATIPEFRRAVIIGLGGAGQQIVLRLKRAFLDTYNILPPSIKLLCLDTDADRLNLASEVRKEFYELSSDEFLHLKVTNPAEFIKSSATVREWYTLPAPIGSITHGAGAVRQNGRLAMFFHINELKSKLDNLMSSLGDVKLAEKMRLASRLGATTDFKLADRDPEIYICGSIAGGTGSGTFIDMAILARDHFPKALIHGFFLTPWVYRNKSFSFRTAPNGYAALTELDNLQSLMYHDSNNRQRFYDYTVNYSGKEVTVKQAPYDLFHLIDGRNEHGENVDDIEKLCSVVSDSIFLSLGSMAYKVDSVVDNLKMFINIGNPKLWNGRYARYSSIGVSSLHYPAPELHRAVSCNQALNLCRRARLELDSDKNPTDNSDIHQSIVQGDLDTFINRQNLHRNNIRQQLGTNNDRVVVSVENYEMSDPDFSSSLKKKLSGEEKRLERYQAKIELSHAASYTKAILSVLDAHILELDREPKSFDAVSQREWGRRFIEYFSNLCDELAEEIHKSVDLITTLETACADLLAMAEKATWIPLIGGGRKRFCEEWAEKASELLTEKKRLGFLRMEESLYKQFMEKAESLNQKYVPGAKEIVSKLLEAEEVLRERERYAWRHLDMLKNRSNHILLGYGETVIQIRKLGPEDVDAAAGKLEKVTLSSLKIGYDKFIDDEDIKSPEQYMACANKGKSALADLFNKYCDKQLRYILDINIEEALQAFATLSDDADDYLNFQFDSLFRLSSAFWSFDRGRLTEQQEAQMDRIINVGFHDHVTGSDEFGSLIEEAKTRFHIRSDISVSTTGDPYRVWMLNYAAAVPAYFMNGLIEARKKYDSEIVPSYHIDSRLEMNVPDLFPQLDHVNIAIRVLGMAIVKGVDLIEDEKLTKGHRFTLQNPSITKQFYYGQPKVWMQFKEMYDEFVTTYDSNRIGENLLDKVREILRDVVSEKLAKDRLQLKADIESHIKKMGDKLAVKDFSKLESARLTYQEVKNLKEFIKDINQGGMGMDIETYLSGA